MLVNSQGPPVGKPKLREYGSLYYSKGQLRDETIEMLKRKHRKFKGTNGRS